MNIGARALLCRYRRAERAAGHSIHAPPLTVSAMAVMKLASGVARKPTTPATSSGVSIRAPHPPCADIYPARYTLGSKSRVIFRYTDVKTVN
ncbi:hypothetical protein MESS2_p90039 [Mesorhizobium metallidurans STM 2683]|uniref:Uncharacterized protein n=1 Tax=Mesorhizobium metallidurans STM 2683 TaxID=1297569 RepID=M5F0B2_9HYPH|nr:hypothetical protein MESS2_p90039 [Mesorhizobium metallidurans STM 2683]